MNVKNWRRTVCGVAMALCAAGTVALANGVGEDQRRASAQTVSAPVETQPAAADDLIMADRLRRLSREIPALACLKDQFGSNEVLDLRMARATYAFTQALTALEYGYTASFERRSDLRPTTRREIAAVKEMWIPVKHAFRDLRAGEQSNIAASLVQAGSVVLHDLTLDLYAQVQTQNNNSFELTTRDAIMMDVAGRPAMLLHGIMASSCALSAGPRNEASIAQVRQLAAQFEQTVVSLSSGVPQLGITPPPTVGIEDKLSAVLEHWRRMDIRAAFEKGGPQWGSIRQHIDETEQLLSGLVELYAIRSKALY